MRSRLWIPALVVAFALLPASSLAVEDTDAPAEPAAAPSRPLDLSARPTTIPYRSVVSGAPVPGARRPPPVPRRRSRMPNFVQRSLQLPDEPDDPQDPARPLPSSAPQEPEITARRLPPAPPRPDPLSDEEIIVWGDRLEQARAQVEQRLTDLGYAPAGQRNGRTVWKPTGAQDSWKPRVILDDDGWFSLNTPVVSGGRALMGNAAMQPGPGSESPAFDYAPPMAAPGLGGEFAGKRVREAAEARVTRQIWDVVRDLSTAHEEEALIQRLETLPDQLDALWYEGRGPDGTWFPTQEARERALLTLWATRTRTVSGETVRRRIADYLIAVVDAESRLDQDLVAEAERTCGCRLMQ